MDISKIDFVSTSEMIKRIQKDNGIYSNGLGLRVHYDIDKNIIYFEHNNQPIILNSEVMNSKWRNILLDPR